MAADISAAHAHFNAWMRNISALPSPPVEVRRSRYGGTGVFALRDISRHEPLFAVPQRFFFPDGAGLLPPGAEEIRAIVRRDGGSLRTRFNHRV
eukprot:5137717-Prymnesium_polylepis.1